jgi:meso-butanediol dehydrogenase / (S,S)-butanediol dehydrogenase / diacetyl reductase
MPMARYDLSGRVAIVTGAAAGIGHGIALRLAREGAAIAAIDIDESGAAAAATEIVSGGGTAAGHRTDIGDPAQVQSMIDWTVQEFGGVDILVNNAGVLSVTPFLELDLQTFKRQFDVNTTGVFVASQAAARQMIEQGRGGKIITIVSVAGRVPSGRELPMAAYVASKHATVGLVRQMALELVQHGILANCVMPGTVDTPMQERLLRAAAEFRGQTYEQARAYSESLIPIGRMETPDDVAAMVAFLASDDAGYSVGQCFDASGGGWFY